MAPPWIFVLTSPEIGQEIRQDFHQSRIRRKILNVCFILGILMKPEKLHDSQSFHELNGWGAHLEMNNQSRIKSYCNEFSSLLSVPRLLISFPVS